MPHYESRMSSKGQITVPAPLRGILKLKEGDRMDFYLDPLGGPVRIIARNKRIRDLVGTLPRPGSEPLTPKAIDDAIGDYLVEKHERISREWNEWQEFQAWKAARAAE
jgi:AbrB family looped-hinge helix DNA binding protein